MRVAVIDYGSGNLRSAVKSFERAAREAGLEAAIDLTADAERVRTADRLVLPGVGAFADCRAGLDAVPGMVEAIEEAAIRKARPFFGICVGMQLMAERGLEHGVTPGLGWIEGQVELIERTDPAIKVPHMGWNDVSPLPHHDGAELIEEGEAYFLHSYHFVPDNGRDIAAMTDHGGGLVAAVARDNLLGVQFHPEKSQAYGIALLTRFLEWRP